MAMTERNADPGMGEGQLRLGDIGDHLGYFLRRLQVWVFHDFIAALSTMNLRPAQYSVLLVIAANPGRSQAEIGRTLNIERARLARMVQELEERGWLRRKASERDARSHTLMLTADGTRADAKAKALAMEHEGRVASFVGPARREQLMLLLREFG